MRRYLPLARRLAARYQNPHEAFEDLVQVANLGLLNA
ncbi:MAG: sigma factor, partial [Solirubrobacteraceae bacterium]